MRVSRQTAWTLTAIVAAVGVFAACKQPAPEPPKQTGEAKRPVQRESKEPIARAALTQRMGMPADVAASLVLVPSDGPCVGLSQGERVFWVKVGQGEPEIAIGGRIPPPQCEGFGDLLKRTQPQQPAGGTTQ